MIKKLKIQNLLHKVIKNNYKMINKNKINKQQIKLKNKKQYNGKVIAIVNNMIVLIINKNKMF